MQTSHCIALKLAAPITTCNSLQSTSVQSQENFEYANANIRLPINPLGLIVKGLYFSCDNVFFNRVYVAYNWPQKEGIHEHAMNARKCNLFGRKSRKCY